MLGLGLGLDFGWILYKGLNCLDLRLYYGLKLFWLWLKEYL